MVGSWADFGMETAIGPIACTVGAAIVFHPNIVVSSSIQSRELAAVCADSYRSGASKVGNGAVFHNPTDIIAISIPMERCSMHSNGGDGEIFRCIANIRCVADHKHRVYHHRGVTANKADFLC